MSSTADGRHARRGGTGTLSVNGEPVGAGALRVDDDVGGAAGGCAAVRGHSDADASDTSCGPPTDTSTRRPGHSPVSEPVFHPEGGEKGPTTWSAEEDN